MSKEIGNFEVVVIGGGAVGMSAANSLAQQGIDVALLEKEEAPAMHQSGRNSGVIHAGYNPKPGTVKAAYCVEGNRELKAYCAEKDVPVREGGILIVARDEKEIDVIRELEHRGKSNGTEVHFLSEEEIKAVEPNAQGIAALLASDGASVDARAYVHSLANDANISGAKLYYGYKVESINEQDSNVRVKTDKGSIIAKVAINAAGLYAGDLAENLAKDMRVIPFRGYYAELKPNRADLINSHVYAAPDLNFPFLGVHLSKRTDGRVIVGPGAMLAFGREAYNFASLEGGGLGKTLSWPGFYRMMARPEFQNLFKKEIKKSLLVRAIAREAMQLVPAMQENDIVRSYAGNRAQLVGLDGKLVDDIVVRETPRAVHVLNVVSPGLTCSLPFGRDIAAKAVEKL